MSELKYSFRTDTLFKILFRKYQDLLKKLVAQLLDIEFESIVEFVVINPEISPEELEKKFCRLDIRMRVNGQLVDLEIQVSKNRNYVDRCLFYWAKQFSSAIEEGEDYCDLPRTIVISIVDFIQFENREKFHSEYQCIEVENHEPLTDKQVLHFFELPKLAPLSEADRGRDLWLKLFSARTEEELAAIDEMGVPEMSEAVRAYRHVAASDEFKEIERALSKARHEEAQALSDARREEREKWESVVAEKNAVLIEKDSTLNYQAAAIAEKDAFIAKLMAQLEDK